jgi:predicted small lipoprotein YifL
MTLPAIKTTLAACMLALLAACGVDGAPTAPDRGPVTISGEASFGVVGTF